MDHLRQGRRAVQDHHHGLRGIGRLHLPDRRHDAVPVDRVGRKLAAAIPGAEYREIPRAGHVVMVDAPREFNAAVLDFLRRPGAGVAPENRA